MIMVGIDVKPRITVTIDPEILSWIDDQCVVGLIPRSRYLTLVLRKEVSTIKKECGEE